MAEFVLTLRQVEDAFLEWTRQTLGMPDDNSTVRLSFGARSQTGSAPGPPPEKLKKGVVFVSIDTTDDGYGEQHHVNYESVDGESLLTEVDEYTEEYAVSFSCYGVESYETARKLRDGLYSETSRRFFRDYKLHFVVGTPKLATVRELIDTSWIERCDFTAVFYAPIRIERADAVGWFDVIDINIKTNL